MEATFWLNKLTARVACLFLAVLCALVSLSASAQPISALPYTNQVNDIDRLALVSITSGTNGTTKQIAYSNLLANTAFTNLVKIQATNAVAELDPRYFYQPQDQNLYLSNTIQRIKNGGTLRILNFGDDAFHPRDAMSLLNQHLVWAGTISSAAGEFYADTSAGVTQNTISGLVNFGTPIYMYTVDNATGGGLTNRVNPLSDTISFGYYAYSGFSANWIVITNDGTAGGAYGIVKTINPNNGGAMALTFTNIAMPTNTWRAAIWTTGTNAALFCGQYLQGGRTNYLWDIAQTANGELLNTMTNAFASNSLVTLAGQYDLVILNDSAGSNQSYTGYSLLYKAVTNRFPTTDLLFLQPPPATNNVAYSIFSRQGVARGASDFGYSVLDTGGMFLPIDYGKLKPFYLADAVHLSDAGNALMCRRIGATILNPWWTIDRTTTGSALTSADLMWRTNAVDGTSTNVQGGVSVGANYIGVTNTAHGTFFNLLKTGWRWMLGGSGSTISGNTNSLAGTNGSGFFVLDASGNQTNSGNIHTATLNATSELKVGANRIGSPSTRNYDIAGYAASQISIAGANAAFIIEPGTTIAGANNSIGIAINAGKTALRAAMVNVGTPVGNTNFEALNISALSATATNGFSSRSNVFFLAPTNAAASGDILQATGLESSTTAHTKWIGGVTTELTNYFATNTWAAVNNRIVTNYFALTTPRTGMYEVNFTYGTPTEGGGTTIDSSSYTTLFWTDPINGTVQSSDSFDSRTPAGGFNKWEYDKSYRVWAKSGTLLVVSNWMQDSFDGGPDTKSTNFVGAFIWARP